MTEAFPFLEPLNALPGLKAGWVERIPDLPLAVDRDEAMTRLRAPHLAALHAFAGPNVDCWRAEQVHGNAVAIVPGCRRVIAADGLPVVPGVDGLLTRESGIVLVIHVADCGAIWLADKATGAIGLLHSGKKGTEGNILAVAVDMMHRHFGSRPADIIAVLSPCIRPPDYEIDFAARIRDQAQQARLGNFIDCGLNTGSDPSRFYSYRKELGKTGRMMAMITRDFLP